MKDPDEKKSAGVAKELRALFEPLGSRRKKGHKPRGLTPRKKSKPVQICRKKNPVDGISVGL